MGADAKAGQAQLGHESIQMTLNLFTHLFEGDLDDTMTALDALHRNASRGPTLHEA